MHPLRQRVIALMASAGVHPGGAGDCDPAIRDERFYGRVLREGSLGLGDSYMDGWWTVRSLDGMLYRLMRHGVDRSEEHTSELQSLMRISYAVFCLNKKNTTIIIQ